MPAISEILDSVRVPKLIRDSLISTGTFVRNAKGLQYYSGGFTVVFPVVVGAEKWAFRCWHSELGNVQKRFKTVSGYINRLNSPYFCDFYYCDEGIVVDGKIFPTTRMKWIDGKTINQYIIDNISDSAALLALASEFEAMIDYLHEKRIAHGDLQHGNIMVQDGKIKLVDYDSLFVPGLEGSTDIITGKDDFQHPKRKELMRASEKVDYFSELVIYLSILALAKQPSLLNDYSLDDSLLFHSSDWRDFKNSQIYKDLHKIQDEDILLLLKILDDYLQQSDIERLKPFTELWRNMLKKPTIKKFCCGDVDGIVFKGEATEIIWEAENVAEQLLDDIAIPLSSSSCKRTFDKDTEIKLTLRNGLHNLTETKSIKVVEKPDIKISAEKTRLKKNRDGIERTFLKWNVGNAHSVSILNGCNVLSTSRSSRKFKISPKEDTVYTIVAVGLDGKTEFKKSISVIVREPANVIFEADKEFTMPSVPVTVSWSVKNAKHVELEGKNVPKKGEAVFTPQNDSTYCLSVMDDFGKRDYRIDVKMLPMPVIKTILVDAPNINTAFNINTALDINCITPHFETIPDLPIIETQFVNMEMPQIPDLKDAGLYVEFPMLHREGVLSRISKFIKRLIK